MAPSGCFIRLEPVLEALGFEVTLVVGEGKPVAVSDNHIVGYVSDADLVLLGMSSSPELSRPELIASLAARNIGKPYGFYGDIPGCFERARKGAWFENLASGAAFYFGLNEEDAQAAKAVFPNAQCFATGNPLREDAAFPKFTREEVRLKLGVTCGETLVLASGGKFAAANMATWVNVMDSLAVIAQRGVWKFKLVLTTHPGDRTPYALDSSNQQELKMYEELISYSPVPTQLVTRDILTTTEIVPGANLIIEYGSSIGIDGAYQNIPVISLGYEVWFNYFEKFSNKRTIEAVETGISKLASAATLTDTIGDLLTTSGSYPMRKCQQKLYPKPTERGIAIKKMADAVVEILK